MTAGSFSVFLALVLASVLPRSAEAAPAFIAQTVAVVDGTTDIADDQVVLRINISNADSSVENNVVGGRIAVCSDTSCVQSSAQMQTTSLFDARDGKSRLVMQMAVPAMTVQSLHFEPIRSDNRVAGDVMVANPLVLTPEFKAGEVMVVVKRGSVAGRSMLTATHAVGTLYSPERETVFYNPSMATTAALRLGVELHIPAGATAGPQLFSIAVHDTGDEYPLIDIFPAIKLRKPMALTSTGTGRAGKARRPRTRHIGSTGVVLFIVQPDESDGDDRYRVSRQAS